METVPAFFVDRSDSPRLEIRCHGVLVEVVDSDGDVVYFARRLSWAEDQKAFPEHYLVIPIPFVHSAAQRVLVEIARTLQIADVQRNVIDTVSLESRRRHRTGTGRQQGQSLH